MPTYIYTKKRFMEFLESLKDDDIICMTEEIAQASYHKKQNAQNVTFSYAANIFERKDTVGHFCRLPTWSFTVCKRNDMSSDGLKIYDAIDTENEDDQSTIQS